MSNKVSKRYSGVILISENREFILQKREFKMEISNPGLITTFGGICKEKETHINCAMREIQEELNYSLDLKALSFFLELIKIEDDGKKTLCKFFVYKKCINKKQLELREGEQIFYLKANEFYQSREDLSNVCKKVLRACIDTNIIDYR